MEERLHAASRSSYKLLLPLTNLPKKEKEEKEDGEKERFGVVGETENRRDVKSCRGQKGIDKMAQFPLHSLGRVGAVAQEQEHLKVG